MKTEKPRIKAFIYNALKGNKTEINKKRKQENKKGSHKK